MKKNKLKGGENMDKITSGDITVLEYELPCYFCEELTSEPIAWSTNAIDFVMICLDCYLARTGNLPT